MIEQEFKDLTDVASHLRGLKKKNEKFIIIYAHNGVGKTRLSGAFKNLGKDGGGRDTLYFNAFTEDLFYWDNDLEGDRERVLKMNARSRFFDALEHLDMNEQVRPLVRRYADFDFRLDRISDEEWQVTFSREILVDERLETLEAIKVSRGEENMFVWCFFLSVLQLVLDDDGTGPYSWVKYLYIDDPISSLDDTNAIAVGNHLAQMLKRSERSPRTVISTHHGLFFNVLTNEFPNAKVVFLRNSTKSGGYDLTDLEATPFLHHLTTLMELNAAKDSGKIQRHHFNMLRCTMEQTAIFLGLKTWKNCIAVEDTDPDRALCERMINVLSHADYMILEPDDLVKRYKVDFKRFFERFIEAFPFNKALFTTPDA